jgi:hypothetical protein
MKNKKLIIGGVIVVGIVAYYFYNKNKSRGAVSSSNPISPIVPAVSSRPTQAELKMKASDASKLRKPIDTVLDLKVASLPQTYVSTSKGDFE